MRSGNISTGKKLLVGLILALAISVSSCSEDPGGSESQLSSGALVAGQPGDTLEAEGAEEQTQPAEPSGEAVYANNQFAADLYEELAISAENLVFSPLSIHQALAIVSVGARDETEAELARALGLAELSSEQRHIAFGGLGASHGGSATEAEDFDLTLANALWAQSGYGIEKPFLETLSSSHDAGLRLEDFVDDPETSRDHINSWAERETDGLIEELMPEGSINDLTRLVITNAINFEAKWEVPFDDAGEREFRRLDGSEVSVPFMDFDGGLEYARGGDYEAVDLPYRGGEYSLLLIVPDSGSFEDVEAQMSAEFLATVNDETRLAQDADLAMPPFEIEARTELVEPLKTLGIEDAFDAGTADFTGISPDAKEEGLHVSQVVHDAVIRVDEEGTEAAAATGVSVEAVSLPAVNLSIDRPFIYALQARDSGAVLFLGRVLDPEA